MVSQLSFASLLFVPSLLSQASAFALPWPHDRRASTLQSTKLVAFQAATPDEVTHSYVTLTKNTGNSSRAWDDIKAIQHGKSLVTRQTPSTPLIAVLGGAEYLTEFQLGGQTVKAIVDTGSSDTWLIQAGFACTDSSGNSVSDATCNFGPAYTGSFGSAQIPNQNFHIAYGDGEFVNGVMGTADVTIAGITVPNQEVALGTSAFWNGDGISSGLIGLAYPSITSAYQGTDPTANTARVGYDPLFTTMYKAGLSSAMFSMAIERGNGGYLAFGGLPPVSGVNATFAAAPIQILTSRAGSLSFYTITPDALAYTGSAKTQKSQYIVDSGTTLVYLPTATAKTVNNLFSPKATLQQGTYVVSCTAKAPSFGVKIGGTTFQVSAADMILKDPSGVCISGIQDGGSGPYILGDVFLQNVVAVFDVGAAQMRFASHKY